INLLGVESAECAMPLRRALWDKLAGEWSLGEHLARVGRTIPLDDLDGHIDRMLAGGTWGRTVVEMG
ncbi:MAG: oxidoreductase, partial [Catalinimonas sp.]